MQTDTFEIKISDNLVQNTVENPKNVEKISKGLNIYNNIHYLFALFLSLRASLRRLLLPLNIGQQDKIILDSTKDVTRVEYWSSRRSEKILPSFSFVTIYCNVWKTLLIVQDFFKNT